MSIIYDALKKVENTNPAGQPLKTPRHNYKKYIMYLMIGCLGILTANAFFNFFSKSTKELTKTLPATKTEVSQPKEIEALPPQNENRQSQPEFILNGIFFSENEGYALINNQIVRQGDIIGNAAVAKISEDGVELKAGSSTINLSTSNQ